MKQQKAIIGLSMLSFAVLFSSCSEEAGSFGSGEGRIMPTVKIDTECISSSSMTPKSRAEVTDITKEDLSIRIEKKDGSFTKTWDKLADYNGKQTFTVGEYTVEAFYGNPQEEGFEKPAFSGTQTITVADGRTTQVALTASPANAMFTLDYSEAFKTYMQAYSAEFVTANNTIAVAADELRPVYVAPGEVNLHVAATTPTGKEAKFNVAKLTAEAGYNYIVHVDINGGEVGSASLKVTFDENLETEEVIIDLSDELLSAEPPTIAAKGFDPASNIAIVTGLGSDAKPTMDIIAMAGLKSVTLSTKSTTLIKKGWPEEIELLNNKDAKVIELGLNAIGLWHNPDKMAIIDFSNVLNNIEIDADNPVNTFTVTVTDALNRVSEPLTLSVYAEGPLLNLSKIDNYDPGENLRVNLEFNGTAEQVRNNVKFNYTHSSSGMIRPIKIVDVEAASRAMNSYIVTIETPVLDTPLELEASCGGNASKCVIDFANFNVACTANDTYATHAYVTVSSNDGSTLDMSGAKFMVKGPEDETYKEVTATDKGSYFDIECLTPNAESKVYLAIGNEKSRSITIKTEEIVQIPNSDLEESGKGSNHNEQTFTGWGTNNPMTTSQGISQDYCRYSGTASTDGRTGKGVELRTCGWGKDNKIWISVKASTVKYIDAGLLHLGASRTTRPSGYNERPGYLNTDDLDCGIAFTSRPKALSFYYKYTTKNNADRGFAEIWVKDAQGNIVASKTADLAAASEWTMATVQLDYPFGSQKGEKIYVRFQSTNNASCLEKNESNFTLHVAQAFVASHLYIDDIELIY